MAIVARFDSACELGRFDVFAARDGSAAAISAAEVGVLGRPRDAVEGRMRPQLQRTSGRTGARFVKRRRADGWSTMPAWLSARLSWSGCVADRRQIRRSCRILEYDGIALGPTCADASLRLNLERLRTPAAAGIAGQLPHFAAAFAATLSADKPRCAALYGGGNLREASMSLSSAGLDPRRRRILFRARRRGLREMDLALGAFADAHLADAHRGRTRRGRALARPARSRNPRPG